MTLVTTVPVLIPLSLLEAIRNLDTPLEDGLEERSPELVAKRFGLSPTVGAQIERYAELRAADGTVPLAEGLGVFTLVGRRPDAALAFADAGRRAARYAARGAGRSTRTILRVTPQRLSRRLGARAAAQVAERVFGAELLRPPSGIEVRVGEPLSIASHPDGAACGFYGSCFAELLRVLGGLEGAMTHDQCRGRGDARCTWTWHEAGGY